MFARRLSTRAPTGAAHEMATVLDRYDPNAAGIVRSWTNFCASTLAVVQLRNGLTGWTVPNFRDEAAGIYSRVGAALAAGDEPALRRLTTRSCFSAMSTSLKERARGERHRWDALDVAASIKQVRIGHHVSAPERRFAQITASIDAKLVWTINDSRGARVGGVGSKASPWGTSDYWVFERCISEAVEAPAWRLKERLTIAEPEAE